MKHSEQANKHEFEVDPEQTTRLRQMLGLDSSFRPEQFKQTKNKRRLRAKIARFFGK